MKEFTTPSGRILKIEEATFSQGCELNSLICSELLRSEISLFLVIKEIAQHFNGKKELQSLTFSDLLVIPAVAEIVSRVCLSLLASEAVRNKVFECLSKSLYNKERITPESFEEVAARKDYFFVFKKCFEINILCFTWTLS